MYDISGITFGILEKIANVIMNPAASLNEGNLSTFYVKIRRKISLFIIRKGQQHASILRRWKTLQKFGTSMHHGKFHKIVKKTLKSTFCDNVEPLTVHIYIENMANSTNPDQKVYIFSFKKIGGQFYFGMSAQGNSPESVLVAYVLDVFSQFSRFPYEKRIRTRFLFEMYVFRQISGDQLVRMGLGLDPSLQCAAQRMIDVTERPGLWMQVRNGLTYGSWTVSETLALLAGRVPSCCINLNIALRHRTERQRFDRVRYVTHVLITRQVMTDTLETRDVSQETSDDTDRKLAKQWNAKMMRMKRKHNIALVQARMQCTRLHKKITAMQTILHELEESEEENSEEDTTSPSCIQEQLIRELVSLQSNQGRHQYSPFLLQFAQLLVLSSRKTYRLIRQCLPLPSESCLKTHYAGTMKDIRNMIMNKDLLDRHIAKIASTIPDNKKPCFVTLGIDAFAFKTFYKEVTFGANQRSDKEYSNAFLFVSIPLDATLRPQVLYIKKQQNGNFNASVMAQSQFIVEKCQMYGIKPVFLSTDGDRFLQSMHDDFFKRHVEPRCHDFLSLIEDIYTSITKTSLIMPVSDPLHLAKNLRGKILNHKVFIVYDNQLVFTSAVDLEQVLELGMSLQDRSQIGRMRDYYVVSLFTLENVSKLLKNGNLHGALLLLPYACIFTLLFSKNLANATRLFLANLAYSCFDMLLVECNTLVSRCQGVKHRASRFAWGVTFAEPAYVRRMMNTCLALGITIRFGPNDTRLDAVGTHLVENSIGIARSVSNNSEYDSIISAFAKAEMKKDIASNLGIELYVSNRINDGGAKITPQSTDGLTHPSNWDITNVVRMFHDSCIASLSGGLSDERNAFISQLDEFISKIEFRKMSAPSSVSNCSIMARNIQYSKKRNL